MTCFWTCCCTCFTFQNPFLLLLICVPRCNSLAEALRLARVLAALRQLTSKHWQNHQGKSGICTQLATCTTEAGTQCLPMRAGSSCLESFWVKIDTCFNAFPSLEEIEDSRAKQPGHLPHRSQHSRSHLAVRSWDFLQYNDDAKGRPWQAQWEPRIIQNISGELINVHGSSETILSQNESNAGECWVPECPQMNDVSAALYPVNSNSRQHSEGPCFEGKEAAGCCQF